ncbi:hypothetical protein M0R45_019618 [Rubus argutus]|uniref:Uncharacterized protein n=1 Tax=Rubus argutus TaxID=59490 RepID=A0AAW1X7W1_RUBAR
MGTVVQGGTTASWRWWLGDEDGGEALGGRRRGLGCFGVCGRDRDDAVMVRSRRWTASWRGQIGLGSVTVGTTGIADGGVVDVGAHGWTARAAAMATTAGQERRQKRLLAHGRGEREASKTPGFSEASASVD